MYRGDIDYQFAPTLAIDVDGLIVFSKSRLFGLKTGWEINLHAIKILDHHMMNGRMIYLLARREKERDVKDIEKTLDDLDFPYNRLFHVDSNDTRELILGRPHVHFYFYMDPLHFSTDNKRKERRILNIAETYF